MVLSLHQRKKGQKKCPRGYKLGFPGGFINRGEGLFEAAKRETLEELGLKINISNSIYIQPETEEKRNPIDSYITYGSARIYKMELIDNKILKYIKPDGDEVIGHELDPICDFHNRIGEFRDVIGKMVEEIDTGL